MLSWRHTRSVCRGPLQGRDYREMVGGPQGTLMIGHEGGGMRFAYHSHGFDFRRYDGRYGLDLILGQTDPALVALELDIGNTIAAGVDPMPYVKPGGRLRLEPEYWHDLAWHLFGVAAEKGLVNLKRGKRALRILSVETEEAIHEIERAVASGIAIELQRALNHYTVVSGIEDDRRILFDSNNNTSIKKSSLGPKGGGKRHNLGERAIFFQPK